MEFITEKLLNILACAETTQLERMKLKLGLQVLCHNIWMTCVILILAGYLRLSQESFILFISYGILKIHVGGIHFHKSWQCLTVTTSFIIGGVLLAQHMTLQLKWIIFLYILRSYYYGLLVHKVQGIIQLRNIIIQYYIAEAFVL